MLCKRFLKTENMRNLTYILILIAIIGFAERSNAQQDPNFTLYNFNMNIINPAFAGSNDSKEITLGYRSQWAGINDAPNTQAISYTNTLKHNLGLGISIIRDQVFVLQETDIAVDVSYKLKVSEINNIYFGIKAGASIVNIDLSKAGAHGSDPLFSQNENYYKPQIGAGLYFKHKDFYISISTPNFLSGRKYAKQGNTPKAAVDNLYMYYGFGYHFDISDHFRITPAIMYRNTDGAPSSTDLTTTVQYNTIQAGMNYRIGEMYSIFGLLNIFKNVKFGAAYDFTTSELNQVNDNGSMEVILKFQF